MCERSEHVRRSFVQREWIGEAIKGSVFAGRCEATDTGRVKRQKASKGRTPPGEASAASHKSGRASGRAASGAKMARKNRQKSGADGTSAAKARGQRSRRAALRRRPASRLAAKPKKNTKNIAKSTRARRSSRLCVVEQAGSLSRRSELSGMCVFE